MGLQIFNHRTHCFPGGNRRDTGFGGLGKDSCYIATTETSPQSLLRCCVLKEPWTLQEIAANRKHFVPVRVCPRPEASCVSAPTTACPMSRAATAGKVFMRLPPKARDGSTIHTHCLRQ